MLGIQINMLCTGCEYYVYCILYICMHSWHMKINTNVEKKQHLKNTNWTNDYVRYTN